MACDHTRHHVDLEILFLEDRQRYLAEIKLTCAECGKPFGFRGLPVGISTESGAHVDPTAQTLRLVLLSPSEMELAGPLPGLS